MASIRRAQPADFHIAKVSITSSKRDGDWHNEDVDQVSRANVVRDVLQNLSGEGLPF